MADETRLEKQIDIALARATTPRGAAVVIAATSTAMTLIAGVMVTIVDREDFPTLGSGLWWAVQTVTTVGYGDNVPTSTPGRFVAVIVMLFGIGFLTVITAAITSTFVARGRAERAAAARPADEQLREIAERLERIEAALTPPH
jgi:voltage-gated potassium channel